MRRPGATIKAREQEILGLSATEPELEPALLLAQQMRLEATIAGGSEMVRRPCLVFGDLERKPALVCSSERSTRIVPAPVLKSLRRKASRSPCLAPEARFGNVSPYQQREPS